MKKSILLTFAICLIMLSGCGLSGTSDNTQSSKVTSSTSDVSTTATETTTTTTPVTTTSTPSETTATETTTVAESESTTTTPSETEEPEEESKVVTRPAVTESEAGNTQSTSFIKILSPKNDAILYAEPIYVEGSTSTDCDKIVAAAKNEEYNIDDVYTLQQYKRGDSTFKYGIKHDWDNLDVGKNTYSFTAYCDGGNQKATVDLFFEAGGGVEMGKPVIYLYPKQEQKVFVLPKPEGGITVSEPALGNGWNVTAYPDGKIVDQSKKVWPYLFWEGYSNIETPKEGFLVHQNELDNFFNEKLSYLGLVKKEIEDFKEYWLEQLNEDKYYFISFISQTELDEHAPIIVKPKPDTVIRVYFDYKAVDSSFTFTEQKLKKGPKRNGFTMTEWGGNLH